MSSNNLKVPRYRNFYDLVRHKGPLGFAKDVDCRNPGIYVSRETMEHEYIHAMLNLHEKLSDEKIGEAKKYSMLQGGFAGISGKNYPRLEAYWREKARKNNKEYEKADPRVSLEIDEMELISSAKHREAEVGVKDMDEKTLQAMEKYQQKLIEHSKANIIARAKSQK